MQGGFLRQSNLSERVRAVNFLLKPLEEGILVLDVAGLPLLANDAARRLLARPLVSRFWEECPDDFFGFSLQEALQLGLSPRPHIKQHLERSLEIRAAFLPDERALLILIRDRTESLELQRQLHQGDRLKELGERVASLAHEIRNPLSGIRGFASLLQKDLAATPHLQEMATHLLDGAKALDRLVCQVLEYARPLALHLQYLDIPALVRSVLLFFRPEIPAHISLETHLPPVSAELDPDAFRRACLNLLLNAVQAMPQGGTLTVSLVPSLAHFQLVVTDTGVGIADTSRLLTPFFTTKSTGTGLGLVEVHKIVQAHKGTLDVRSQVGRGSTFTLTFPYARETPHRR